jgi:hypothetical protein
VASNRVQSDGQIRALRAMSRRSRWATFAFLVSGVALFLVTWSSAA